MAPLCQVLGWSVAGDAPDGREAILPRLDQVPAERWIWAGRAIERSSFSRMSVPSSSLDLRDQLSCALGFMHFEATWTALPPGGIVAGTLWYRLNVEHVYQRRFGDSQSLAEALAASHWYIVSRRPSVRIISDTVQLDDQILAVDFITRDNLTSLEQAHTFGSDFRQMGPPSDFRTYSDGAYFSVTVGDGLIHGDAWALASLLSSARKDIARQEVLYIGQAFGPDGTGDAWSRTQHHQKLQRIYEDHVNTDYEIFVTPLSLDRKGFSNDDHIDDDEHGPSLSAHNEMLAEPDGGIRKPAVDLIEHSLISYFAPFYNEKLKEWRPDRPTSAMEKMRSAGFRLLHVHLSGWWGLARFYSDQEPDLLRSHFISHDLASPRLRPRTSGTIADTLSGLGMSALLVREGKEIFAGRAEQTGVLLRVFGDLAPAIRKPPNITLSRSGMSSGDPAVKAAAHGRVRAEIRDAREAERKASEPIPHPGKSTYDPATGTISVGISLDGTPQTMPLHDPETGTVNSVMIFGDPKSGKSNALRLMIAEAFGSGRFIVLPSDPSGRNGFADLWNGAAYEDHHIATDVDGTLRNLTMTRQIIEDRLSAGDEWQKKQPPGVLVAIDDADTVLQHSLGSRLVTDILDRGGNVGVGLLIGIADVCGLEGDVDLMYELMACRIKAAFTPNARHILSDLSARYGERRRHTWREDGLSFILHRGGSAASLGLLTAAIGSDVTLAQAQAWFQHQLALVGVNLHDWKRVDDDPRSWWTMGQLGARFWFLRQHSDEWALIMNISKFPASDFPQTVDMIKWAEEVIENHFTVKLQPWMMGPTTGEKDSISFYANVSGDIVAKDTTDLIQQTLLNLY
jgi:hypothetical protein